MEATPPPHDPNAHPDAVEDDMFGPCDLTALENADQDVDVVPARQAAAEVADMIPSAPGEAAVAQSDETGSQGGPGPEAEVVPPPSPTQTRPLFHRSGPRPSPQTPPAPDPVAPADRTVRMGVFKRFRRAGLIPAAVGLAGVACITLWAPGIHQWATNILAEPEWHEDRNVIAGTPPGPERLPSPPTTLDLTRDHDQDAPVADPITHAPDQHDAWRVEFTPLSPNAPSPTMRATELAAARQMFAALVAAPAPVKATGPIAPPPPLDPMARQIPDPAVVHATAPSEPVTDPDPASPPSVAGTGPDAAFPSPATSASLARTVEALAQDLEHLRVLLQTGGLSLPDRRDDAGPADPMGTDPVTPTAGEESAPAGGVDRTARETDGVADGDTKPIIVADADARSVLLTTGHATVDVGDRVEGYGRVAEVHQAAAGRILIFE